MNASHWPPIPERAVKFLGRWMLPERIEVVEGRPYVRCYLHGLIPADHRCEDSPGDHLCNEGAHPNAPVDGVDAEGFANPHDDQATSHKDWTDDLLDRINAIRDLHVKDTTAGGMTSGGCKECGLGWPCPTFHFASGWGEMHDCLDARWCAHVGVVVHADEMGYA